MPSNITRVESVFTSKLAMPFWVMLARTPVLPFASMFVDASDRDYATMRIWGAVLRLHWHCEALAPKRRLGGEIPTFVGASSKRVPVSNLNEHWAVFVEGCGTAGVGVLPAQLPLASVADSRNLVTQNYD